MSQRLKLLAAFHAVATGTLRLDEASADRFAASVANGVEAIHVIGQLCTGPNALKPEVITAMLHRWLGNASELEFARAVLLTKSVKATLPPQLDAATTLLLHSTVFNISIEQRGLTESQGLQVANHIRSAAPAFFALEQKCRAPDRHTQRVLCAALRAAVEDPLEHVKAAAELFNSEREA